MSNDNSNNNGYFHSVINIFCSETLHRLWLLFIIAFGFLNVWIPLLTGDITSIKSLIIESGDLYIVSIGILSPCIFDLLALIYFEKIQDGNPRFIKIRIVLTLVGILLSLVGTLLAIGKYKSVILVKVGFSIITVLFAFLCYLSKYLSWPENANLDEVPYHDEERNNRNKLLSAAENKSYANLDGKDIKL